MRNYGANLDTIIGGKSDCEHDFSETIVKPKAGGFSPEKANVGNNKKIERTDTYSKTCSKCGAWKGQLGQEPTWHDYINNMVRICEELKRIMKEGGSLWINIGDTFWGGGGATGIPYDWESISTTNLEKYPQNGSVTKNKCGCPVCVSKQKIGIPARLRIALNDIGLISRDDVIWYKPNHMPGSQKDRFTTSYEYLFRFVKNTEKKTWWYNRNKREWTNIEPIDNPKNSDGEPTWAGFHYYFDLDSVRKPHKYGKPAKFNIRIRDAKAGRVKNIKPGFGATEEEILKYDENAQNLEAQIKAEFIKRTKLEMEAEMKDEAERTGYSEHSAARTTTGLNIKHKHGIEVAHELGKTPDDIISTQTSTREPKPHEYKTRDPERHVRLDGMKTPDDIYKGKFSEDPELYNSPRARTAREGYDESSFYHELGKTPSDFWEINPRANKLAWCKTCKTVVEDSKCQVCGNKTTQHFAGFPEALVIDPITVSCPKDGIVFDPFVGSGTTCVVAKKLGRNYLGLDINEDYAEIARWRIAQLSERLETFC